MECFLRGAFLVAFFIVALHSYFATRFLVRERGWYFVFYGGLAVISFGVLVAPLPAAFALFTGLSFLLLGVGGIVRHLKRFSVRDHLTGLYSRTYFFEEWLPREVKRQERIGGTIAFVMIDVDGLKRVNDEKGHHAGDELLQTLAISILRNIRGGDIAVRFGGDEILLAFPGGTEEGAIKAVKRIEGTLQGVSFSFGIGVWSGKGNPEEAIRVADHEMYISKRSKKNDVENTIRFSHS